MSDQTDPGAAPMARVIEVDAADHVAPRRPLAPRIIPTERTEPVTPSEPAPVAVVAPDAPRRRDRVMTFGLAWVAALFVGWLAVDAVGWIAAAFERSTALGVLAATAVIAAFGRVDSLVNAAGLTSRGTLLDTTPELFDELSSPAPRVDDVVLPALAALDRGGTLAIAGIHLTDIPPLNYEKHLFQERQLRSVTSNTREDAREFLGFAAEHKLKVTVHPYPLDQADQALRDLKAGRFDGAAVLVP